MEKTEEDIVVIERNIKILGCTCLHPYQDKRYGKGRRVHNKKRDGKCTCTVCGTTKMI